MPSLTRRTPFAKAKATRGWQGLLLSHALGCAIPCTNESYNVKFGGGFNVAYSKASNLLCDTNTGYLVGQYIPCSRSEHSSFNFVKTRMQLRGSNSCELGKHERAPDRGGRAPRQAAGSDVGIGAGAQDIFAKHDFANQKGRFISFAANK